MSKKREWVEAMLSEHDEALEAYPVGLRVSRVNQDEAGLLEQIDMQRGLFDDRD